MLNLGAAQPPSQELSQLIKRTSIIRTLNEGRFFMSKLVCINPTEVRNLHLEHGKQYELLQMTYIMVKKTE